MESLTLARSRWFILGAAIMGVGSLIGTGGIITLIMDYIGVTAPVIF